MKKEPNLDPNKRTSIIKNGTVQFQYPDHFTLAQCGQTEPGGAKLNFPNYVRTLTKKRTRTFIN